MYSIGVHYLLVGNYGVGNFGDEALKEYFLSAFPEAAFQVLSAHPKEGEFPRLPAGFRSLFLALWWRTFRVLRSSDGLVFGGGTLFTDSESVWACLLWWWHAFVCRLLGKPFFLAFQGIGPFHTRMGEWCARWTVAHAACVSVRDQASFERVKSWKTNTNIIQTFDPIFSLLVAKKKDCGSQKLLVIIPRKNSPSSFQDRAVQLWESKTWEVVRILSLQPEDPQEQEICRTIAHVLSEPDAVIVPIRSAEELASHVCAAGFVLAQRYHGALAALALGIPFEAVSQREGDKLSSLSRIASSDISGLIQDGERRLRIALFPVLSESGKIQI